MRYKILVNGDFQKDFVEKIVDAKKRIYCQFMTFEGDDSGLKISKRLIDAKKQGVDVKVIIEQPRYTLRLDYSSTSLWLTERGPR